MTTELSQAEMEQITKAVEAEFPNDPALQQVHIARKIISAKAKREGRSFFEYIRAHQDEILRDAKQRAQPILKEKGAERS